MGKYMKKANMAMVEKNKKKNKTVSPLMDLSHSPVGVCTRAKTLALQRLQNSPAMESSAGSYLQLRSRRLQKPQLSVSNRRCNHHLLKQSPQPNPNPSSIQNSHSRISSRFRLAMEEKIEAKNNDSDDLAAEASFGDNVLEFERSSRSMRETTPCSLIKDPETITPPGSTNKRNSANSIEANRRSQARNSTVPTSQDINNFFTAAEQQQHRQFIDKYNFDLVKGKPLAGRYEWVKVSP